MLSSVTLTLPGFTRLYGQTVILCVPALVSGQGDPLLATLNDGSQGQTAVARSLRTVASAPLSPARAMRESEDESKGNET